MSDESDYKIKVIVRVRPFNSRELNLACKCIISMDGQTTSIQNPKQPDAKPKSYTFDHSYWSHDVRSRGFANQEKIYSEIGLEMLNHAFDGYNVCVFAYGQTGAGKSYTMMGKSLDENSEDLGLVPRMCKDLFERIKMNTENKENSENSETKMYAIEVSYMEIYCERVRDLLNPKSPNNLRIREHPSCGPYVEDLSKIAVTSYTEIMQLMDEGNKSRTVAATNMNEQSSRSHAVFTIIFTQATEVNGQITEKMSKISLVDLAGSERAMATGAQGDRLKEGSNINKSLTTLRNVISGLAKGKDFIPYRDSHLTWLLKENLGGNSKTAMIANLSPACVNYEETLSTLKYANSAKEIVCKAKVNEDANVKLIRELKEEIQMLRKLLDTEGICVVDQDVKKPENSLIKRAKLNSMGSKESNQMIADKIEQTEKLMNQLNETWEEKIKKSEQLKKDRKEIMEEIGVVTHEFGVFSPKTTPSLVNLNEDALMNECLIYYLKPGITRIGRSEADTPQDIQLSGANILREHCTFNNCDNNKVTLRPCKNAQCYVNGILITEPVELRTGCRVILGRNHVFRFQNPQEARSIHASSAKKEAKEEQTVVDWNFAQLELQEKQGIDLKQEMENKFIELAEKCRKEKEEAQQFFDEQEKMYKETIKNLYDQLQQSISMQASSRDTLENSIKQPLANHIEMLNKNKFPEYIFEDLKNDREIQLCKKVVAKWKTHQFTSLRDDLWGNAIFLKECNALSNEMKKKVQYQFTLIQNTENSNCLSGSFSKLSQEFLKQFGSIYSNDETVTSLPKTLVAVEVKDQKNGAVHYWSLKKLRSRLELMREKYAEYMREKYSEMMKDKKSEFLKDSKTNEFVKDKFNEFIKENNKYMADANEKSPNSPESEKSNSITEEINDPFTDRFPWYRLIGRSYLYLTNLLYNVRLVQTIPIVSEKCDIKGYLQVLIEPNIDEENGKEHDKSSNIKQSARCLFEDDDPAIKDLEDELDSYSNTYQYNITDLTKWVVKKLPTGQKRPFTLLDPELKDEEVFVDLDLSDDDPSDRLALSVGDEFTFRIVILQIINLDKKYADVIVNFNFLNCLDEAFSERITTSSMNTANTIGFFSIQNITVKVTANFLKYLRKFPIVFEVFGNNQQHPLHEQARDCILIDDQNKAISGPPKNLFPTQIPFSTPIKPQKLDNFTSEILDNLMNLSDNISQSQAFCQLPVHVNFEICELNTTGDYSPVPVRKQEVNKNLLEDCEQSVFLLKQGVQRRIRITLAHHQLPESFSKKCGNFKVQWMKIVEVVLGRVRSIPYCSEDFCDEEDNSVVSLPLFHGELVDDETKLQSRQYSSELEDSEFGDNFYENGEMIRYRFEAAWDSSLHNSELLDKVGEGAERTVYFTLSAYLELENCNQPVVMTKDLSCKIYARDSRLYPQALLLPKPNSSLIRSLLSGNFNFKNQKSAHQVSSVYELILRKTINAKGSPGAMRRKRKILDTSNIYVRGQDEFLKDWRPKGDLLLIEHQWTLERNLRICLSEKVRHILRVRDQLEQKFKTKVSSPGCMAIKKCSSCGKLSDKLSELEAFDKCSCSTAGQLTKSGRMPTSFSRSNLAALAAESNPVITLPASNSYSNLSSLVNQVDESVYEPWKMSKKERCICSRCVELIQLRIPSKPYLPYLQAGNRSDGSDNNSQCNSNSSSPDLLSPDQNPYNQLDQVQGRINKFDKFDNTTDFNDITTSFSGFNSLRLCLIPELEESRLSKVISKQGLLYHLEMIADKTTSTFARKYVRRFIVVKRPYLFLYNSEKEMEELGVINLTNTELIISEINKDANSTGNPETTGGAPKLSTEQTNRIDDSLQIAKTFILKGMISCDVFQCLSNDKENSDVVDWLYAINPLAAGQIKSRQARKKKTENSKTQN